MPIFTLNSTVTRVPAMLALAAALLLGACGSRPPARVDPSAWPGTPSLSDEQAHDIAIHALGLVGTP